MSDDDITNAPTPGNSRHVTTGLPSGPPVADWPNIAVPRPNPQTAIWLRLRAVGTVAVAAVFVYLCWLMSGSVYPNPRILAGPVVLLRSWHAGDKAFGVLMIAGQLPCIFAVGVRFHAVTLTLSVLGCAVWVAVGGLLWASAQ